MQVSQRWLLDVVSCEASIFQIVMTDAGVTALSHGCGQLQSINLVGCYELTDAGVIALDAGCGQL